MKNIIKKVFLIGLVMIFVLLMTISCSDSIEQKAQRQKGKIQIDKNMSETTENTVSKTTCTDCHNVNEKGNLKFRNKNGKFELKKKVSD